MDYINTIGVASLAQGVLIRPLKNTNIQSQVP